MGICKQKIHKKIGILQNNALRAIIGKYKCHITDVYRELGLTKFADEILVNTEMAAYDISSRFVPDSIKTIFPIDESRARRTGSAFSQCSLSQSKVLNTLPTVTIRKAWASLDKYMKEKHRSDFQFVITNLKTYHYSSNCTDQNCYLCK